MALACDYLHNLPACLSGSAGKYCGALPYGNWRSRNAGECPHRVQGIRRQFPALGPSDRRAQGPRPPVPSHVRHRGDRESGSGSGRPVPARPLHLGYGEALLRHLQLGEGCPRPRGVQSSGQAKGAAERRRHREHSRPRWRLSFCTAPGGGLGRCPIGEPSSQPTMNSTIPTPKAMRPAAPVSGRPTAGLCVPAIAIMIIPARRNGMGSQSGISSFRRSAEGAGGHYCRTGSKHAGSSFLIELTRGETGVPTSRSSLAGTRSPFSAE